MAFGGAGPLFGTLLADELEIPTVVVPPYAGNFSAWGLLGADLAQTAARTRISMLPTRASRSRMPRSTSCSAELEAREAQGRRAGSGEREIGLDMRYVGQEHTLTVSIPSDERLDRPRRPTRSAIASPAEYERTFGHSMDEVGRDRLRAGDAAHAAAAPGPGRASHDHAGRNGAAHATDPFDAYSFTRGERARVPPRSTARRSRPARRCAGPAIVTEDTATTYLDAGFAAASTRPDRS